MIKKLIGKLLTEAFNLLLGSQAGKTALHGHLKVLEVREKETVIEFDANENYRYKLTVERL